MVNLLELDLAKLNELDHGVVAEQIMRLVADAVRDLENRPMDSRARTVGVKLKLTPKTRVNQIDERTTETVLDGVGCTIDFDLKIPNRQTLEYDFGVARGGKLVFNPESPYNHRQQQLPTFDQEPTVPMKTGSG